MKRHGFTIVELLIVIVIIAILAAITIVAYNGIQQRARVTQLWSGITQTDKSLRLWRTELGEDTWPLEPEMDPLMPNNPSIAKTITDTGFKKYMQQVPTIGTNWFYDYDNDDYVAGNISSGVNLCIDSIDSATATALDKAQDDGVLTTGKIRYNGSRLYYSFGYTKYIQ